MHSKRHHQGYPFYKIANQIREIILAANKGDRMSLV